MPDTEPVYFRLFQMSCCTFRLLWIEPLAPRFCPRCGVAVGTPELLSADPDATLTYEAS